MNVEENVLTSQPNEDLTSHPFAFDRDCRGGCVGHARHQVMSEGEAVCHLEPGGFVGSMAFNRFVQEPPLSSRAAGSSSVTENDAHRNGAGGVVQAVKEAVLDVLRGPSVVGNVAMSLVPDVVDEQKDLTKMERSKNTVTATSDVSVVRLQHVCSYCSRRVHSLFTSRFVLVLFEAQKNATAKLHSALVLALLAGTQVRGTHGTGGRPQRGELMGSLLGWRVHAVRLKNVANRLIASLRVFKYGLIYFVKVVIV